MHMRGLADTFGQRFESFLNEHDLVRPGDSVALAVSGGIDSMTMLRLFLGLRDTWHLQLSVVHVNHGLRGRESDDDEAFVRNASESVRIPFLSKSIDVGRYQEEHGLSKQEAARNLRYEAIEEMRLSLGARSVATAHQASDNAETVLLNALRGTGIRGLSGIPLRREQGSVIRPLLFADRDLIAVYASEHGVTFREDSSNASTAYLRNTLRHVVLPDLERLTQSNVLDSLNRVSAVMRSLQERVQREVADRFPAIVSREGNRMRVSLDGLLGEPAYVREEIILEAFRTLGIEPSSRKIHSCLDLATRPIGRYLHLASAWCVYHDRGALVFAEPLQTNGFFHDIQSGKEYSFQGFSFASHILDSLPDISHHPATTEFVDAEKLGERLVLRNWRHGDWFIPLGMDRKKKLSDFFTNRKLSLLEKQATPILESDGSIVWVCGLRLDHRFKVTAETRSVIQLDFSTSTDNKRWPIPS